METIVTFLSLIAIVVIASIAGQAVLCYLDDTYSSDSAWERLREVYSLWSTDSKNVATIAVAWLIAAVIS